VLVKRKPRRAELVLVGDWNVDQLPMFQCDPWSLRPNRSSCHHDRRVILSTFCDSLGVNTVFPERAVSAVGGPFGEASIAVPFTRVPIGESSETQVPSLLDYFMQKNDMIQDAWMDWFSAVGDHALVVAEVRGDFGLPPPRRGNWHCNNWQEAVAWMAENASELKDHCTASECFSFFSKAQDILRDHRSCSQRRRDRVPEHIREVLQQIPDARSEAERLRLRRLSSTLFHAYRAAARDARAQSAVKAGHVFEKSKKLHPIEALRLDGTALERNNELWTSPLHTVYSKKWGTNRLQLRSSSLDFIASTEGSTWTVDWSSIERALDTIRKPAVRDSDGISVQIIRAFAYGHPEAAVALFSRLLNSRSFMKSFTVYGKVYGKESSFTAADNTRALLPLPSLLIVADAIIACKINDVADCICFPPAGVMFGARKGTQVLDIAHAVQLHMQKGGDNFGSAGFAQGDISSYYDSINCLSIARWIAEHGSPDSIFWASAFLRLQLLPSIHLTAGNACTFVVNERARGTLTGSRSAVAAGRIPVETVACDLSPNWHLSGVRTSEDCSITFASWVDNYYAFGSDVSAAIRIAENFEDELQRRWGLSIKPSSRSVMSASPDNNDHDDSKWPLCACTDVLGHLISYDSSPWPCWRRTEKRMWGAFWKNCVGQQTRGLSVQQRCKMMNRCVRPVLFFRNTRWPFTISLADAQRKLQRKMLVQFLQVERWPEEPLDTYSQRRFRAAATLAKQHGDWGVEHAKRVCTWSDHLERARNHSSLASLLYRWHNAQWLEERRLNPDVGGPLRPGTRSQSGFVCARWDESVAKARQVADGSS
jgi:hypothetical protein